MIDLQVEQPRDLDRRLRRWRPDAVCFGGNYLANIPEIVDLAKSVKAALPDCFVFVGGHSASFIAADLLRHGDGAIDCVLRGEAEASVSVLLGAVARGGDIMTTPGVFIVDDVAFVHAEHGLAIAEAVRKRGVRKRYYLETRGDVLLRNKAVFRVWRDLGLEYMFIGLEAIDEEGLELFRKRIHLDKNFEALAFARSLGVTVAINLIVDPDWDRQRFETIRRWCLEVPEIVNLSVNTPYPGTEIWRREQRRLTSLDYRLFDIQHAVLPTRLPLPEFYAELVRTQQELNNKHLGWTALRCAAGIATRLLLRGQTNFVRMLRRFNSVFSPRLQLADHQREVRYAMTPPPQAVERKLDPKSLYVHGPAGRRSRSIDDATETLVNATRMQPTNDQMLGG
jgi:hopanoid C-3 methylase